MRVWRNWYTRRRSRLLREKLVRFLRPQVLASYGFDSRRPQPLYPRKSLALNRPRCSAAEVTVDAASRPGAASSGLDHREGAHK